jgi:hypothetical protein
MKASILFGALLLSTIPLAPLVYAQETTQTPATPSSASSGTPKSAPSGRKPFVFIYEVRKGRQEVLAAWENGLGHPGDIVSTAPSGGDDKFESLSQVKTGIHAWMAVSLENISESADQAAKTDRNIKWVFYNLEQSKQTATECKDPLAAVLKVRKICDQHGWKLALIPSAFIGQHPQEAEKLAPHLDAFLTQCQKFQDDKHVELMRRMAMAVRAKNPKCLVGAQLGVGVPEKGYGPPEKAVKFYLETRDFLDLYSVWWGTSESMIELLQKVDAVAK